MAFLVFETQTCWKFILLYGFNIGISNKMLLPLVGAASIIHLFDKFQQGNNIVSWEVINLTPKHLKISLAYREKDHRLNKNLHKNFKDHQEEAIATSQKKRKNVVLVFQLHLNA
jgi:hypothetical protein